MAEQRPGPIFKYGDRVKLLHSGGMVGRVVEYRGPLAPGRVHVYRVRVPRWPEPTYIEVREDQLRLRTIKAKSPPASPPQAAPDPAGPPQ